MKKIISFFLSLLVLFSFGGCGGPDSPQTPGKGSEPDEKVIDLAGQTALSETIITSNQFANGVQAYYTDNERAAYVVANRNMELQHELSGKKFVSSLRNTNGAEYLFNTMDSYVVFNEESYYGSDATLDARVNTTKLGYYYYSTYIRDMNFDSSVPLHLEKAYHTYSDRVYQQFRIIAEDKSDYVSEFGFEIKVPKTRVAGVEILDNTQTKTSLENGTHTFENPQYLGLDITEAGVVGIITTGQGTKLCNGQLPKIGHCLFRIDVCRHGLFLSLRGRQVHVHLAPCRNAAER